MCLGMHLSVYPTQKLVNSVEWKLHIKDSIPRNAIQLKKNPAYGRQSISRPMQIVAPIPQ